MGKSKPDLLFQLFLVSTGGIFGFILGASYIKNLRSKFLYELVEETTLKTEFLNWIVQEGLTMEQDEFCEEFITRAKFINSVINVRGKDKWEIK